MSGPTEREVTLTRVLWDVVNALTAKSDSSYERVEEALRLINKAKPTMYAIEGVPLNTASGVGCPAIAGSTPVAQLIASAVQRLYGRLPDGEVVPMSVADLRVMAAEIQRIRVTEA